jgi:hypothetical protein
MFKVPEKYRITDTGSIFMRTTKDDGNNGVFVIPYNPTKATLYCIASDGMDWDHVSVSIVNVKRCPVWRELCYVKDLFWSKDDCVIQYHPPEKDYVNVHEYCLHLWKPQNIVIPQPPKIMVG